MPVNPVQSMSWTNQALSAKFQAAMEEQARANLAKRLKELRAYKGWKAEDLAHASGVSARTISRLETASIEDPRETTLERLAGAFKMSRTEFAGPRITPEAVDQAVQTQLDGIERKLDEILSLLSDPEAEIERETAEEDEQDAEHDANNAASDRKKDRRDKAP